MLEAVPFKKLVSYETIRQWCTKYGVIYCNQIKKNCVQLGDVWYLDEVFIKINGVLHSLWRAEDQDGDEIDILVQKRKNKKAAIRLFKRLLKGQGGTRLKVITDKLASYTAAKKELIPSVDHSTVQYENNRCELSHQPTRQQERLMRKFKSQGQAQRFLSCHGVVNTDLKKISSDEMDYINDFYVAYKPSNKYNKEVQFLVKCLAESAVK